MSMLTKKIKEIKYYQKEMMRDQKKVQKTTNIEIF